MRLIFSLFFLFLIFHTSLAQKIVIRRLLIEGNKVTQSWVIQRILEFSPGDTVTLQQINEANERLSQSSLFSAVSIYTGSQIGEEVDLIVKVKEKWYVYPFPVFGLKDRDWKKFYGGLGIRDNNFLGRNEKLACLFALGYDPFISVAFTSPWVGRRSNYLFSIKGDISRGRLPLTKSEDYASNLDNLYGDVSIGLTRLFGRTLTTTATLAYNYVLGNSTGTLSTISVTGRDVFASAGLNMIFDNRDVKWFPAGGGIVNIGISKFGLGESQVNFSRFEFDLREFASIYPRVTIAARVHGNLAEGPLIPPYYNVFIGYGERIRGMFSTIQEGQSIVGSNLELRFQLFKNVLLNFPLNLIKDLNHIEFQVYWSFFGDAGETFQKGDMPSFSRLLYGYGCGLSFVMPFNLVAQLAIARGNSGNFETIIVLGETI